MVMKSVGFRLQTDGKAQVQNDFRDVAAAGKTAMAEVATAAEQSAARATAANDEFTDRQIEAYKRQAAQAKVAAAQAGARSQFDTAAGAPGNYGQFATVNLDRSTGAARESAAVFEMAARAEEELANAAMKVRAAVDPAFAAQERFNREMAEARNLVSAGALSLDDYCAKLRIERTELAASSLAHSRGASSAGAHRTAMQGLSYQLQDTFTQLSMGANVFQVVAIQGGQLAGQFSNLENKAGAVARFMLGPWGLAITAGALVLGPLIGKLLDTNSALDDAVDKLKKDAEQSDITQRAKQHFAMTLAGVTQAIYDQKAALDQEANASRSAAERANDAAGANLKRLLSIRETTAALLAQAKAEYAVSQSILNPQGGAVQYSYAAKLAQIERDAQLADAAVITARQSLDRTQAAIADEASKATREDLIKRAYDGPSGIIAKAKERLIAEHATGAEMERQLRILRDQEAAKIKAVQDAQRAAQTAANDNRQTGRQVTLGEAETIVRNIGGVITSASRTFDQQRVLYERYLAGKGPLAAKPGTSDHESDRALDIRKTPGMSLAKIRAAFAAEGVAVKQLLDEGDHFHVAWGKGAQDAAKDTRDLARDLTSLQGKFDPAEAAAREYRETLAKIAALKLDPATAARYAEGAKDAFIKARAAAFSLPDVEAYRGDQAAADKAAKEQDEADKRRAEYLDRFRADQSDALADSQAELRLVGASDQTREATLSKLRLMRELLRNNVDLQSDEGQAILAAGAQIDANNARLKVMAANIDEVRGFGNQFVDTVLSPDTWSSWGNAGKTILNELKTEFIKLALLNPLKNLINGDSALPTLASAFSSLGGLFGGTNGAVKAVDADIMKNFGRNASGTERWSGGMTWVAENGPELINLPGGTKITPAAQTRQILSAAGPTSGGGTFHFDLRGAVVTQDLLDQMNAIGANAADMGAMRGAAGGSALAEAQQQAAASRRLGRRW